MNKKQNDQHKKQFNDNNRNKSKNIKPEAHDPHIATAPYNFVPMTNMVIPSPLNRFIDWNHIDEVHLQDAYKKYLSGEETYSGTLHLTLKNLTPLFIGAGKGTDNKEIFFSPTGQPVIPGSTIRGMVRNLFKIITEGTMRRNEDFTDRHLYFRCLMATGHNNPIEELHDYYVKRMSSSVKDKDGKTKQVKKAKGGYLFRKITDGNYYISPCHEIHSISTSDYKAYRGNIPKDSKVEWDFTHHTVYILTGLYNKSNNNKNYIRYLELPDWSIEYRVPDSVIFDYESDKNRRGVNLLDERSSNTLTAGEACSFSRQKNLDFLVPCFFVLSEQKEVESFGHGRSYRIPYRHSVGDRVNDNLKNEKIIDFADAVFGRKEFWAGRVSFEDAILETTPKFDAEAYIKPQMGPNPTAYQLYLNQVNYPPAHWDSENAGNIRGYKMYWHQHMTAGSWKAPYSSNLKSISSIIKPLLPNHIFKGNIHFTNLTSIELGALLKVFHLGDGAQKIVYKLGKGKSLGMGSVEISCVLSLDTQGRYSALFDQNEWKVSQKTSDATFFLEEFSKYLSSQLGKSEKAYHNSITSLTMMMDWDNTTLHGWNSRIAPMCSGIQQSVNGKGKSTVSSGVDERFKSKNILEKPKTIIRK